MGVLTILMGLWGFWLFNWLTPPQHNPFKQLDLAWKPGLAMASKSTALQRIPPSALCCWMQRAIHPR